MVRHSWFHVKHRPAGDTGNLVRRPSRACTRLVDQPRPPLSVPARTLSRMNAGGPMGRVVDGRFELIARLGGGGMGLVWRARDLALHREVALKEVRPPDPALLESDPTAARMLRERVLREARSLARID